MRHILVASLLAFAPCASAINYVVTDFGDNASGGAAGTGAGNAGDLRSAILAANAAAGGDRISFNCLAPACTITLQGPLPSITDDLTIDGGGKIVIDGVGSYRVFFVDSGLVLISDLSIRNAQAKGGAGGNNGGNAGGGGGGGAGLGAALFVNQAGANVTVNNVSFADNRAAGGNGGAGGNNSWAGGGGGGLAFAGGTSTANGGGAGGGGVLGAGANAASTSGGAGGAGGGGGGGYFGGGTAGAGGTGYAGNSAGAGGVTSAAGAGGFGGGGGGTAIGTPGAGGFGGGGGGNGTTLPGGAGGAGGGGGGTGLGAATASGGGLGGGISGGTGRRGGGGGAAAGPDIFVRLGTLMTAGSTSSNSCAVGGLGGSGPALNSGSAGGADGAPVFNFGGTVNGATTTGAILAALGAAGPARSIAYSASTLSESAADDGTITTTLTLTLSNETFSGNTGDNFVTAGKVTVTNVPPGLTAVVTRTGPTTLTLALTGTATNHAAADSIANLTVVLNNGAFGCSSALSVANATRNDLAVSFTTPAADLAVSLAAPLAATSGGNIPYTLTLTNNGPGAAQSPAWTDTLPSNTTFVSLAQTSGPAFACTTPAVGAAGTVTCSVATLANAASAGFTLTVATATGPGSTLMNTATASSGTADPTPANNSATATTVVGASPADVAVTLAGPASVIPGGNAAYTVTVANNGPGPAQTVSWTHTLAANTSFVSLAQTSGAAFACTTPAMGAVGTVACSAVTLAAGASATFNLVAQALPSSAGTTITNTVSVSAASTDPTPANNSASTAATSASRSVTASSPTGGGSITATFTGGGATCSFSTAQFIPVTGHSRSPPAGSAPADVIFPYGLFDFTTTGCTPGSTLAFTIVYPTALARETVYYKYGPTPAQAAPGWYVLPSTVSGSTVTFSITDGGLGDDDLTANGTVVDQGGPGLPGAAAAARQVPTLSEWMLIMLALLMMAGGAFGLRRRAR
jgi:uncharacterized repeat protein (TIGR01451 family)